MNAITEIQRIEADLYRFIQNASEAPRLMRDYLGDLLGKSHVPMDQYDETCGELQAEREKLETSEESLKDCEAVIQLIATALHGIIGNEKPDFPMILMHIASVIEQGDHSIRCDADEVCEAIEEIVAKAPAESPSEIQTPSPTAHCSPITDHSLPTQPEPTNQHHENQDTNTVVIRTPRCLPGFGKRAA
jgi:hypothetical protein